MTLNILYAGNPNEWDTYRETLSHKLTAAGLSHDLRNDLARDQVDYIVYAPNGPIADFEGFDRLKAVLSLWAGVERIVGIPSLRVPLTRMVDHGLTQGMTEWVLGHTLRHHLNLDADINRAPGDWDPHYPPLAQERSVTILGVGKLGQACARALLAVGFPVTGWSRSAKTLDGIATEHGTEGLKRALSSAQILITLLPNTPETENTLNTESLGRLSRGAVIINPGRGTLIDDNALLAALDSGQVGHATLDVFRVEPLPEDHPYWTHPRVTVTPHIAAETRASTASDVIVENIRRNEAGEEMLYLADRALGY